MLQQELTVQDSHDDDWTVSHDSHARLSNRRVAMSDGQQAAIFVSFMVLSFAGSYFLLEGVQHLVAPSVPGGQTGPWLIRPIRALHFGGSIIMGISILLLLTNKMRRRWKAADLVNGVVCDPYDGRPWRKLSHMIGATALACIYGLSAIFYICSWTVVSTEGIETQSPWDRRNYNFDQVLWLETIPTDMRSKSLKRDGPWYQIQFTDGRKLSFGLDNEESSATQQAVVAEYIAKQSNHRWRIYGDAERR